jgi:hypothetical protein
MGTIISAEEQVRNMLAAVSKCPNLQDGIREYLNKYPTSRTQTMASVVVALRTSLATYTSMHPAEETSGIAMAANKTTTDKLRIADLESQLRAMRGGTTGGQTKRRSWGYCWTHGGKCSHTSKDCIGKIKGHEETASFKLQKNGNPENFQTQKAAQWIKDNK